jgi:hypothetical protein
MSPVFSHADEASTMSHMSCHAHNRSTGRIRRLLLGALALVVLADIVTDSVARLSGHPVAAWLDGLEVFAVLVLAIGGVVLMWQVRTDGAAGHTTSAAGGWSSRPFHVADGGAGVSGHSTGSHEHGPAATPRVQDGGTFRSR